MKIKAIILQLLIVLAALATKDQCPIAQYYKFSVKQSLTPQPIINDPYRNPTSEYLAKVKQNLQNKQRVCAIKYKDILKQTYQLKQFTERKQAEAAGWIVTHQGVCGKCSTTKDLYVYLTIDLTAPVRTCGVKNFYSRDKLRKCIKNLGFTDPCTQVWLWNVLNTKKHCNKYCISSYLLNRPYIIDGHLNKCLQCDEDISGPIFKYQSARTRRNSGIKSQIDRPSDQIYNLTHCYY